MVWWSEGSQHWDHGIPMLSLCCVPCLPSVPQTATTPSADGRPTQGQAASVCANSSVSCAVSCAVLYAARMCVCVCVCVCVFLCVRLLADLCMPISGFCVTSRKSQEKQNWTLCKQPRTNFWNLRPTLYLHYQLCSLRISCFGWGRSARTQHCFCGLQQMVYVIAYCVSEPATATRVYCTYKTFDDKFISSQNCEVAKFM